MTEADHVGANWYESTMRRHERALILVAAITTAASAYCFWRAVDAGMPFPRIQLGTLGEWIAAVATVGAVWSALRIATRDRKERQQERRDEQTSHARLVQMSVKPSGGGSVTVSVRNYGQLPVLDVDFLGAKWSEHPDARLVISGGRWIRAKDQVMQQPALMPHPPSFDDEYNTVAEFGVTFKHPTVDDVLAPIDPRTAEYQYPSRLPIDVEQVQAVVEFKTADGARWGLVSKGSGSEDPVRLS